MRCRPTPGSRLENISIPNAIDWPTDGMTFQVVVIPLVNIPQWKSDGDVPEQEQM